MPKTIRIKLLSDLHFEFHKDGGRDYINSLPNEDVDILILAGDICPAIQLEQTYKMFCRRFFHSIILGVLGNHEYYGCARADVLVYAKLAAEACNGQAFILENEIYKYKDLRILGTTMWFKHTVETKMLSKHFADYKEIPELNRWESDVNREATKFLEQEASKGSIVVTHHLPSSRSVHENYAADPSNCFFVCDMVETIFKKMPKFWFHGHTHNSFDYKFDETRVVCNPQGTPWFPNKEFDPKLLIEL